MRLLILGGVILLLSASCRDYEAEKKIDPYLKIVLRKMENANKLNHKVLILFKSTEQLSERHRAVLRKKGVNIQANINRLYTAKATPAGIYYLAKMHCIISIQPSKELQRKINVMMSR